jgi:hypothetical protein
MVIENLFNNKIQIFFFWSQFFFKEEKALFVYTVGKNLILSIEQNGNKISKIKNGVLCHVLNEITK